MLILTMEKYITQARKTFNRLMPKNAKEVEWWVKFRSPEDILRKHATYLYLEIILYALACLTFFHAMRSGGRFRWLWFATVAHGLTVEIMCYIIPDIDNYWHAQSMVMLLGQRLPLHIVVFYPVFIYTACAAVSHMNIKWWAEPFAVGLSVVLIDVPFDILGIKLLWWTWHDDDPNIFDRHYWVPWTSYYFHATFASSFTLLFFGLRRLLCRPGQKYQSCGFFSELFILIITGLFATPLGILQFVPVYHPLHDSLGIHSEVCFQVLCAVYVLIVWSADRTPHEGARLSPSKFGSLALVVLMHYFFYIYLVFNAKPENEISVGLHQQIGNCNAPIRVLTPFGQVLKKNKFLCVDRYNEDYFNFKCVKKVPAPNTEWYTICGTPYENHAEYILVVCSFCFIGLFWFMHLLFFSGPQPRTKTAVRKQHRD